MPTAVKLPPATLYLFAGLPGSGKSTLARLLAQHLGAAYVRIDTIEQALRDVCALQVEGEGYRLAYRIAADNLRLGMSVVADSCNPITLTRREWEQVALDASVPYVHIEVICSNKAEHRQRIETRASSVAGLELPTWQQVQQRTYHAWAVERIVIDTAAKSVQACMQELLEQLAVHPWAGR
ncbi:MAG: AAA family ATPase [Brachymonas sp.]|nr:AAA family ATPase [Brachymonas sp.]